MDRTGQQPAPCRGDAMSAFAVMEDTAPTLAEAQKFVGGYVQIVELSNGDQLLVDDQGLLKGGPINPEAVAHAMANGRPDLTYLRGPVLCLRGCARWS